MADNIKAPSHYVDGREYEPKDVIRDWGLNFNLGSAVKYISRAGRKGDKLEDLQKAKQFLEFEIEAAEKEKNSDIGMTCKEAVEICEAIAKGFEEGLKEGEETYGEAIQTRAFIVGLLSGYIGLSWIPDRYKSRVIDKIVQLVLDNPYDIDRDIPTKELQDMIISRIVEKINSGELGYIDIPDRCRTRVIDKMAQKVLDSQCDIVLNRLTDEVRKLVINRIVERINNDELDCFDIFTELYCGYQDIRDAIARQAIRLVANDLNALSRSIKED